MVSPRSFVTTCLLALAIPAALRAVEAGMPRHPAPSPDGSVVAFSWQGDIWIVPSNGGQARRLTAHPAADRSPVWSRDGRWIAFSSDRHGNADVFVMPPDGSQPPKRITFASSTDVPLDFHPGTGDILFLSRRDESVRGAWALYHGSLEGGTPILVQEALARDATWSPDGQTLAFVRGHRRAARFGYRGSGNREIWLHRPDGSYDPMTDFEGDDDAPSWIDRSTLLYRSEKAGRKGLFFRDLETGSDREFYRHETWDVRYPRASASGNAIACELGDRMLVWRRDPRDHSWTGGEISIDVAADTLQNRVERRSETSGADELAVHPDEKFAALIVRGDVFVTRITDKDEQEIARPPTIRVTETQVRELDLSWSPDGGALLFASDRGGRRNLYLAKPAEDGSWDSPAPFVIEQITDDAAPDHSARFSPDGGRIAFLRGKGDLVVRNQTTADETLLVPRWGGQDFVWSPDGKWIASSWSDMDYNSEIYILPADGGEPYNVSRHPDSDDSPHWSPDGKRLLWLSQRHGDSTDVWGVWLAREDDERTPEDWLRYWKEQDKKKGSKGDKKDDAKGEGKKGKSKKNGDEDKGEDKGEDKKKEELPVVRIDFDGLWRRASAVTSMDGEEGSPFVSKDGKRIFFTAETQGDRDLYSVRWDGTDRKEITKGGKSPSSPRLTADGKTIYYLSKGKIARISTEGKDGDPVPFEARYEIDRIAEREAVFHEAWSALSLWFYDPSFHGTDWVAMAAKYRPLALAASHDQDFSDVMNLMLGELNSSHQGYSGGGGGGRSGDGRTDSTGWIGARFDPGAGGPGLLIREVLPDSPAARTDVALRPGDRILEVEGKEVGETANIFALFNDTIGRTIRLGILRAGTRRGSAEETVRVHPISLDEQRQLLYEDWVRRSTALVEERSGGRLGYLHIQGMNIPSFEEFERNLYAAGHGKEGLIIDVRSNGGGWTTDYLMAVLNVRRHARTIPRDADPNVAGYPQGRLPLSAWTKPALALCNEESFSNAEIFSWAFQNLRRGMLVGTPTFGGVISTGGTRLLNGAFVRLPMRGWYVAGSDINMENNGAVPDVVVAQPPEQDMTADQDAQLERAVDLFLQGLEKDPRHGAW